MLLPPSRGPAGLTPPNGPRLGCGAPAKEQSCNILPAPAASSACQAQGGTPTDETKPQRQQTNPRQTTQDLLTKPLS